MVRLVVRFRSPSLEPSRAKSRDFTRSLPRRLTNGADEDRTRGLLLAKQALSQTELRPLYHSNHPEPVEGLLTPCLQSRCSPKLSLSISLRTQSWAQSKDWATGPRIRYQYLLFHFWVSRRVSRPSWARPQKVAASKDSWPPASPSYSFRIPRRKSRVKRGTKQALSSRFFYKIIL